MHLWFVFTLLIVLIKDSNQSGTETKIGMIDNFFSYKFIQTCTESVLYGIQGSSL